MKEEYLRHFQYVHQKKWKTLIFSKENVGSLRKLIVCPFRNSPDFDFYFPEKILFLKRGEFPLARRVQLRFSPIVAKLTILALGGCQRLALRLGGSTVKLRSAICGIVPAKLTEVLNSLTDKGLIISEWTVALLITEKLTCIGLGPSNTWPIWFPLENSKCKCQ